VIFLFNLKKFLLDKKIKRWQIEKPLLEQKQLIAEEKEEIISKNKKRKTAFGKLLMIFLFVNFTILELFTGWVTIKSFSLAYTIEQMPDFSPLITLLGAVIGETLSYGIYCHKAKAENTEGGIVFEATMHNLKNEEEEEEGLG
jgi:predicted nucleic acid-binding Zn ribbon protein